MARDLSKDTRKSDHPKRPANETLKKRPAKDTYIK